MGVEFCRTSSMAGGQFLRPVTRAISRIGNKRFSLAGGALKALPAETPRASKVIDWVWGALIALLLSDCRATTGDDPHGALAGLDRVDVLGTSSDEDAVAAGRALAARGRGRYISATRYTELRTGLAALLH